MHITEFYVDISSPRQSSQHSRHICRAKQNFLRQFTNVHISACVECCVVGLLGMCVLVPGLFVQLNRQKIQTTNTIRMK